MFFSRYLHVLTWLLLVGTGLAAPGERPLGTIRESFTRQLVAPERFSPPPARAPGRLAPSGKEAPARRSISRHRPRHRLVPADAVVVALHEGIDAPAYFARSWPFTTPLPGTRRQFLLHRGGWGLTKAQSEAERHHVDRRVAWAEPDYHIQFQRQSSPNDPLFPEQWHLNNTGQGGGVAGADAQVTEAWALGVRGEDVVIAIIDDGIETTHPDLAANLFQNEADPPDGLDNDGNGYVDDLTGWNFVGDNNDPNPGDPLDTHGTPVAGLAAAVGGNGIGITGVAPAAKLLPIKVLNGEDGTTTSELATALRYAAGLTGTNGWRGADILSTSLFFPESAVLDSALEDVTTRGRGGLGCPLFATTGNLGSGYLLYELTDLPAGRYFFEWSYVKDEIQSGGEDTCWVADVLLPDGTFERFDGPDLPDGWDASPYGEPPWIIEFDPAHAFGTGSHQARAGAIGDSASTTLRSRVVTNTVPGSVSFYYWISSEEGFDGIDFWVFDLETEEFMGPFLGTSGEPEVFTQPEYPARLTNTIAVGASTDFDYRADYSQYGEPLDILAPSDGGRSQVTTTDLTGLAGNSANAYTTTFGGTSAATPIAAGIGALMLQANPTLTAEAIRLHMRQSADRIGPVAYEDGSNLFYGSGRVNAGAAVRAVMGPLLRLASATEAAFEFQVTNLPGGGATVIVEQSLDLMGWTAVQTNASSGTELDVSIPRPDDVRAAFYRLRIP